MYKPIQSLHFTQLKLHRVLLSYNHNNIRYLHLTHTISPVKEPKTFINSVDHSCRSILKRQGNLLPLDSYSYSRRLFYSKDISDISSKTSSNYPKPCVFAKQSTDKQHCHPKNTSK